MHAFYTANEGIIVAHFKQRSVPFVYVVMVLLMLIQIRTIATVSRYGVTARKAPDAITFAACPNTKHGTYCTICKGICTIIYQRPSVYYTIKCFDGELRISFVRSVVSADS